MMNVRAGEVSSKPTSIVSYTLAEKLLDHAGPDPQGQFAPQRGPSPVGKNGVTAGGT